MRNFLTTLFLSQGVPMLLHGDEYGRSQQGNNNAYCQDNELSWFHWDWNEAQQGLHSWAKYLASVRRQHGVFRRMRYFQGRQIRGGATKDILWLRPNGEEMTEDDWTADTAHALGVRLAGAAVDLRDENGRPLQDNSILMLFNSSDDAVDFRLPMNDSRDRNWSRLLDSFNPELTSGSVRGTYRLDSRSVAVLADVSLRRSREG
jgi:glycogen operon protein